METDLTIPEVLADPLIAQLRLADRVGNASFAQLMESAARVHARQVNGHLPGDGAAPFYHLAENVAQTSHVA